MLQGIQGVIAPAVYGGKLRRILAYIDPYKMSDLNLSGLDVVEALQKSNVMIPTGNAKFGDKDYQIITNAMPQNVDAMDDFLIRGENGVPVKIKDVGKVEDSHQIQTNVVRIGGKRQVYIPIYRQPGANPIEIINEMKSSIKSLLERLPKGMVLKIVADQSQFVREAIKSIYTEVGLGGILSALVVLIFLGNLRASLAVFLSIPLSILFCFIGLYASKETINAMTLGGLALAVGRLIDDSVVVLENTVRHQEMRKSAPQAALEAAGEVAMPVLAATITTIIVFVPVVFLSGIAKFLFTPLAKSVAFSILASYVISMTIIPLFCASFLKSKTTKESASKSGHLPLEEGGKFERFAKRYEKLLVSLMKKKTLVMGSVVLLFFASLFLYPFIGKELFPRADVGYMTLYLRLPTGTRIEKTEDAMSKIEQSIKESVGQESIETMITNIGVLYDWPAAYTPNSGPGDAFIELELSHHRKYSMEEYSRRIRELFKKEYPQVELAINTGGIVTAALNMGLTSPINIQVAGNDLKVARGIAEEIMKRAEGVRGAVDTRIQERLDYPQIEIELNREAIAAKRMSVEEVVKNIVTALNSSVNFKPSFWIDPKNGNHYFLGAQYPEELIKSIETLQNLPLTGKDQKQVVLLKEIAHFKETTAPSEIRHRNIQRVVNVLVNTSGRDVGSVASEIKKRIRDISLPEGYKIYQRGEIESMNDSFKDLGGGLCLAIILVYLVLAAQFRSFRDPLLILITVPMGFIGVLAILWLSGSTLNIQSFIGVIFMVGISVSNGILLVEFANRLKKEGLLPSEAAVKAARIRLRPILMTTLAAFLGLLPMAIGFGHGSEANVPLGRAVVGGLLVSTILTLLVLPLLYAGVENWKIFPLRNKKAAVLGLFILFCVSCGNAWAQETPTAESVRILTLKETIDTVFRQNPEILMAKARHTQGQADVTIESSAYWPRVNLSGMDSWGLGGSSSAIGITGLINSPNRKGLAGGIDASWVVFDFGRTTSKVNAAVKKEKAREAEIVERMANLKLMAIQSYGEGLFYSDLVKLLKERESRQENLTAEIEKYVRSGLNSPVELNLAKASLENTHAAQAQAVGRLVQSWEMLKELMGVSSNEFFSFEIPEGILPDPGPSETLLANAAKNRPEMKLAERNYEAASAERWAAQLERAPKLVAVSSAGFLEDTNPPGADEWSAGIGVTMPVFDGFQMEGKLNKAKAIEDEARALLDEWKNRIRREVASAYAQWEAAKKSQQTMEEQLRLTQSAYDLAHKRYSEKMGAFAELRDSESAFDKTAEESLKVRMNYYLAYYQLLILSAEEVF